MFEDAKTALLEAAQLAPKDADVEAVFGQIFLDSNNPPEAAKSFQAALCWTAITQLRWSDSARWHVTRIRLLRARR